MRLGLLVLLAAGSPWARWRTFAPNRWHHRGYLRRVHCGELAALSNNSGSRWWQPRLQRLAWMVRTSPILDRLAAVLA